MAEDNSVESSVKSATNTAVNAGKFVISKAIDLGLAAATAGASEGVKLGKKALDALKIISSLKPKEGEKKDNSWKWVLVICIALFFGLPLLTVASITGALVPSQSPDLIGTSQDTSLITPAPLQCSSARHEAEKVICWLKEGYLQTTDCSQSISYIIRDNFDAISQCLLGSGNPLINSVIVNNEFRTSVNLPDPNPDYSGKLQCVGFVKAIEKSLGHNIEDCGNAKDFWGTNCPQNYEKINTTSANDLKVGDLAVRTTDKFGNPSLYGHISIIVETQGNVKIIVAEAVGDTGQVLLEPQTADSYTGFLRYKY